MVYTAQCCVLRRVYCGKYFSFHPPLARHPVPFRTVYGIYNFSKNKKISSCPPGISSRPCTCNTYRYASPPRRLVYTYSRAALPGGGGGGYHGRELKFCAHADGRRRSTTDPPPGVCCVGFGRVFRIFFSFHYKIQNNSYASSKLSLYGHARWNAMAEYLVLSFSLR